ncbi:MAG TPA: O-antigen ligase family protein [Rubrivivax sp.]|nr:O-antigen ligase family protein [Rubrivivax sp.]
MSILPAAALALAWTAYLPIGLQYLALGTCSALALRTFAQQERLTQVARHPIFAAALALWAWLALSSAWSPAPAAAIVSHLWMYALPLLALPLAFALEPPAARRALLHFIAASTVVAAFVLLDAIDLLPLPDELPFRRPFVDVRGNQRIAFSILLALASAIALHLAIEARESRSRGLLLAAALLCLAALTQQDRRTGMLSAPLLLAVLALAQPRMRGRRMQVLALVVLGALAVTLGSSHVRDRFNEGLAELQAYDPAGPVDTSWGMRARMAQVTGALVLERPLIGHGVGSWVTRWRERVRGEPILTEHTTPHNEYLLLAEQGGAIALLLAGLLWLQALRGVYRHGAAALPALLVLVAMTWAAGFNVVLRDAKFALMLLSLAMLSWAAARAQGPAEGAG